jgi:hypothetical protein
MNKKQFIQENVHRNLKSIEVASNLNAEDYRSLKEAVLVSINSNKFLVASKKLEE